LVCRLASLQQLVLSLNALRELPPTIGRLTKLQWLYDGQGGGQGTSACSYAAVLQPGAAC
jgi:hypothetical protein